MKVSSKLYSKIKQYCVDNNLVEKKDRILIAVSGGPDSVFLLHFMALFSKEVGFHYAVCHAEHGIRDKESLEDQKFVRSLCNSTGVKLYEKSIDVPSNKRKDESLEEAARRLRYKFFREVMKEEGFNKIATGHTYDDNTETILLRLLLGTGPEGVIGIRPLMEGVIRPLLCVRKKEILSCLEEGEYRVDQTNLKMDYLRNKLRLKVIPTLKEINSLYDEHIQRFARIVHNEGEVVKRISDNWYHKVIMESSDYKNVIDLEALLKLDIAIRRRILIRAIRSIYNRYPGYVLINRIANINLYGNKVLYSNKFIEIRKEYEKLIINKRVVCDKSKDYLYSLNRYRDKEIVIDLKEIDKRLKISYLSSIDRFERDKLYVDIKKVQFPLIIRNRREGDSIKLPGTGTKKIKNLFIDDKVPRKIRNEVPVIVDGSGKVVGIFRVMYGKSNLLSSDFLVGKDTERILLFELI